MKKLPLEPATITAARADTTVNKYQRWLENRATEAAGLRTKVTELETALGKAERTVRNLEHEMTWLKAVLAEAASSGLPPEYPPEWRVGSDQVDSHRA